MEAAPPDHLRYEHEMVEAHRAAYPGANVWHWSHVPLPVLIASGYIHDANQWRLERCQRRRDEDDDGLNHVSDYGADAVAEVAPNVFHIMQAKLFERNIGAGRLGTFIMVTLRVCDKHPASVGFLYTSSEPTRELSDDFGRLHNFEIVRLPLAVPPTAPALPAAPALVVPWVHQAEALDALRAWDWSSAPRGALVMPPGSGKTMAMGMWGRELKRIVVCSPTRALAAQMLKAMGREMPDHRRMLVDSDSAGTRDSGDVAAAWADAPLLISTTYVSLCDLVVAIMTADAVLMVDEAHHLNDETRLGVAVERAAALGCRVLLVTGTPPAALMADDADDQTEVVYLYPYERAVQDERICDYGICLPLIMDPVGDPDHDVLVAELGADMVSRCHFLTNGMLQTGATRCIIYADTVAEATAYRTAIVRHADQFHAIPAWAGLITGETPVARRDMLLQKFQADDPRVHWFFMCSVRVLDEGIDVPACDAVYIANSIGNDARFVQRMCRANRLDYVGKVANVFVWSDDVDMDATLRATARVAAATGRHPRVSYVSTDFARAVGPAADAALVARVQVLCVTVHERWHRRLDQLGTFLRENGRRPSQTSRDVDVKRLGQWCDWQLRTYNARGPMESRRAMRTQAIHDAWTALLDEHPIVFATTEEQWHRSARQVNAFVERAGKRPLMTSNDPDERTLGRWVNKQSEKFNKDGPEASKRVMTNPVVHAAWATLVGRHPVLATTEDRWFTIARKVRGHAERTGKRPSRESTDADEKWIGTWVGNQIKNHNPEGAAASKMAHRKPEMHAHWAALIIDFPFLRGGVKRGRQEDE